MLLISSHTFDAIGSASRVESVDRSGVCIEPSRSDDDR
jgi:hypothetical protein